MDGGKNCAFLQNHHRGEDLSAKMARKSKSIQQTLNLTAMGETKTSPSPLRDFVTAATSLKSPLVQKNLPFRKSSPNNKSSQTNSSPLKCGDELSGGRKENKNSLKTLSNTDQLTKNTINQKDREKSQTRKINTLSEKFPKNNVSRNHKVTEYFPVRRSVRKTNKTVLEEKQKNLEECVLSKREDGLKVVHFEGKGRGVVTTRKFSKGEFVVEYSGELIDMIEAKIRENNYAADQNTGCYMYYFKYKSNKYCVDATAESGRLGRLVNHSRNGNLTTKIIPIDSIPHLILVAKEDIEFGEEVCYDYGDRSKESLKYHPWLAS